MHSSSMGYKVGERFSKKCVFSKLGSIKNLRVEQTINKP